MNKNEGGWFVYLLLCSDGSLYTGITNDLERRITQHNDGKGAKYTRSRRPVKLVYRKNCRDQSDALKQEHSIKKMSRDKKWQMIDQSSHDPSE
jgi:putative endonuclease